MDKIKVTCGCGKQMAAPPEFAGKTVRCPACREPLQIKAPGLAAEPKAAAAQTSLDPSPSASPDDLFGAFPAAPPNLPAQQFQAAFPQAPSGPPAGISPYAAPRPAASPQTQRIPMLWVGVGGGILAVILLLVVGLALVGSGSSSLKWKTYRSPVGRYSIDMPGKVQTELRSLSMGDWISMQYEDFVEREDEFYSAMYYDCVKPGYRVKDPEQALTQRVNADRNRHISIKHISINGYPGREVISTASPNSPNSRSRIRYYLVGRRMYLLDYTGPASKVDSPDALHFLNSFKLN